ncbi:MAG: class I SAM-dependent methyltransferase [Gallionellaceae bacterium]|jgi:SAM-dependent methyltransferase|nr:class I SAM-dependent methyltransferase [Gallionellaceae bacterium]
MSTADSLNHWFATRQGKFVLAREQAFFDKALADLFGYNAVQLGLCEYEYLRASRMPTRVIGGALAELDAERRQAMSAQYALLRLEMEELPFDSSSLDLVVMPHVLEFHPHPHHVLREVERVLMPEGHVIIAGFNPRSLWGLRRALGRKSGYPWNGKFISLSRMKDWLALLGLDVVAGRFSCYAPPLSSPDWQRRFNFMEPAGDRWWAVCGGVYFLQAVKRVPGVRPIKPNWNRGMVGKLIPAAPGLNNEMPQEIGSRAEKRMEGDAQ